MRENRHGISKVLQWAHLRRVALTIFILVGLSEHSPGQLPKPDEPQPSKAEPAATVDPLGRETPRGALNGLLMYGAQQDYATAPRYLQSTPDRDTNLVERVKELQALRSAFKGNIALVSDDPNETVEDGLPAGEVRAGALVVSRR